MPIAEAIMDDRILAPVRKHHEVRLNRSDLGEPSAALGLRSDYLELYLDAFDRLSRALGAIGVDPFDYNRVNVPIRPLRAKVTFLETPDPLPLTDD